MKLGVLVRWLDHASFEIKVNNFVIHIDPYADVYEKKVDVILISHAHSDHCDPEKVREIQKDDTRVIGPAGCSALLARDVETLKPGDKISIEPIEVEAVEAYNYKRFRSPGMPYHPKGLGIGYLVTIGHKTIYHAGDTDFIPEMRKLEDVYLALLPIGGIYTMSNPEAVEAVLAINPKFVIPMHRRQTNAEDFQKQVEANANTKVILLNPGEQFRIE